MIIKVLGTGCTKCKKLVANAKKAVGELGISATIEKIEDMQDILAYGVMSTPALVIDDQVVSTGKLLSPSDIKKHLV